MKLLGYSLIIIFIITFQTELYSQDDSLNVTPEDKEWNDYVFDNGIKDILGDPDTVNFMMPTIDLLSGFSTASYHNDVYKGDFEQNISFDLRLGFTNYKRNNKSKNILFYNYNHFFIGNSLADWTSGFPEISAMKTNTWRFGFSNSKGYAYLLGELSNITLYHSDGLSWSKINFLDEAPDTLSQNTINAFGDAFRFGDQFEGGINVRFTKNIAITGAYERAIVFPRHLFFYWMVSEIIEKASHGLLNEFIYQIKKSSPELIPVVYFVLKNALSYGIFELRKSNMNWPFNTTAPLMFDNFKVGLSFNF